MEGEHRLYRFLTTVMRIVASGEREVRQIRADRPPPAPMLPLVEDLERWMRADRCKMSRHSDVAKAMDYMLKRWPAFVRFLGDGRICLSNNAAERALRGIALGRKARLFAGSERGGEQPRSSIS